MSEMAAQRRANDGMCIYVAAYDNNLMYFDNNLWLISECRNDG